MRSSQPNLHARSRVTARRQIGAEPTRAALRITSPSVAGRYLQVGSIYSSSWGREDLVKFGKWARKVQGECSRWRKCRKWRSFLNDPSILWWMSRHSFKNLNILSWSTLSTPSRIERTSSLSWITAIGATSGITWAIAANLKKRRPVSSFPASSSPCSTCTAGGSSTVTWSLRTSCWMIRATFEWLTLECHGKWSPITQRTPVARLAIWHQKSSARIITPSPWISSHWESSLFSLWLDG